VLDPIYTKDTLDKLDSLEFEAHGDKLLIYRVAYSTSIRRVESIIDYNERTVLFRAVESCGLSTFKNIEFLKLSEHAVRIRVGTSQFDMAKIKCSTVIDDFFDASFDVLSNISSNVI